MTSVFPDDAALREARLESATRHPNVITMFDVVQRPGATILVSEHAAQGSLADHIAERGPIPPDETLRVLDGVLAGLAAVHAAGLVHRDLKPSNVLLTEDGTPRLADFGIARIRSGRTARFDEPDAMFGTPDYMAPEVRRGRVATPAADVYAVGLLARRTMRSPIDPDVDAVLDRALAEDPAARWPTAEAFREALGRAAGAGDGESPEPSARAPRAEG